MSANIGGEKRSIASGKKRKFQSMGKSKDFDVVAIQKLLLGFDVRMGFP